jgi:hypothetical protein
MGSGRKASPIMLHLCGLSFFANATPLRKAETVVKWNCDNVSQGTDVLGLHQEQQGI